MDICSDAVSGEVTSDRFGARPACITFSTDEGRLGSVLSS